MGWGALLQDWDEEEVGAATRARSMAGLICPVLAHLPLCAKSCWGKVCELTWLLKGKKRRAPHMIGQVGRLGRSVGAGGSKLERFLVISPSQPNPQPQ